MKKFYVLMIAMLFGCQLFSQTVTISNVVNVTCNGSCNGSAMANQSGFVPAGTYSWAPGGQTTQTATNLCAGSYTCTVTNGIQTATATVTIAQPSALTVTSSQTNVSCFGGSNGSATAVATGGTPNYSYSWNTVPAQNTQTATNLAPGSYTCTVTDNNGCTTTSSVTITQPASAVSATSSNTPVNCFGGSDGTATAIPTGGTPAYTYNWNTVPAQTTQTATGLPIGTYGCTITDANGCATSVAVTLTQPATAVSTTVSSTSVSCNGGSDGSATVAATGGTPGYTFMWMPGNQVTTTISGLIAGTYTATATDTNGCVSTSTITVTQPAPLMANVTVVNDSCNGVCNGAGLANPTGGTSPYFYAWTSGNTAQNDSNLCAGSHGVVVTDVNGCTTNQIFTVTEPAVLVVTATGTDATCVGCMNGSATVAASGGTGPYTYLWMPGSQTTQTASGLGLGTYTVCVTDANGCAQVCDTVMINDGTAVQNLSAVYGLKVFPNPATNVFFVNASAASSMEMNITLRDITGKIIFTDHYEGVKDFSRPFDISAQPSGIYMVEIRINNELVVEKLVK
jgi:hypothetical protein